jgi:hypothetical protein
MSKTLEELRTELARLTVAIKDDTGAAGTQQTIYWRAYV